MASIRARDRNDGTQYYSVLYRHSGKQTSRSFEDYLSATRFCDVINKFGVQNALATLSTSSFASETVTQWVEHYIDHMTGVEPETVTKYRAYLRNDIAPGLGDLPLTGLTGDHVKMWINTMAKPDKDGWQPSPKTIRNKHGLLAAALSAAVPSRIASNPCSGIRLPRWNRPEMLFLNSEQFDRLLTAVTERWRPLVEFLVASGCRWGEATALRPSSVDRELGTVRIEQAWKHGAGGYRLGPPKTPKSVRTINLPHSVLNKLDYSHEYLFVGTLDGPVRYHGFHSRVWQPAVRRAWPPVGEGGRAPSGPAVEVLRPRVHDLRHTAASWMIQRGVILPVVCDHLGHESIQTTVDLYGHLDRRSMATAAAAIDDALHDK